MRTQLALWMDSLDFCVLCKCCIPLLSLTSCSACSFERGNTPNSDVWSCSCAQPTARVNSTRNIQEWNSVCYWPFRIQHFATSFSSIPSRLATFCSSLSYLSFPSNCCFSASQPVASLPVFSACSPVHIWLASDETPLAHRHWEFETRHAIQEFSFPSITSLPVRLRATKQSAAV